MTDYCNMILTKELHTLNSFLTEGFFCWLDRYWLLFHFFLSICSNYQVKQKQINKQTLNLWN